MTLPLEPFALHAIFPLAEDSTRLRERGLEAIAKTHGHPSLRLQRGSDPIRVPQSGSCAVEGGFGQHGTTFATR